MKATCRPAPEFVATLEMPNGQPAQLSLYIAGLIRSQDLAAWRDKPEDFSKWLKTEICNFINTCDATIHRR